MFRPSVEIPQLSRLWREMQVVVAFPGRETAQRVRLAVVPTPAGDRWSDCPARPARPGYTRPRGRSADGGMPARAGAGLVRCSRNHENPMNNSFLLFLRPLRFRVCAPLTCPAKGSMNLQMSVLNDVRDAAP